LTLLGKPCPLCEGIGALPDAAVDDLLRALAAKRGLRLSKAPEERKPATDWAPVIAALSAARVSLGFGEALYTGSSRQRRWLAVGTVDEWIAAIESQRASLASARHLTPAQKSAYLSLETISRNWERCLQNAPPPKASPRQLDDGRWTIEEDGHQRILTEAEIRSLGLED
jgi:hypothetical protein